MGSSTPVNYGLVIQPPSRVAYCQASRKRGMLRVVTDTVDLAAVMGRNARELRGDANLNDVAKVARACGLNWGTGRVSDLEHGKVSPTLPTLVALALIFSELLGRPVTLADLVRADENIAVTTRISVTGDELRGYLSGDAVTAAAQYRREVSAASQSDDYRKNWPTRLRSVPKGATMRMLGQIGEPEERLARELGIDRTRLAAEMLARWKKSFSAERDQRAGPEANAQKKGRVARALKADLKAVLDGDD
jgi:transcriptional regulator with XRE-family HTH domain